MHRSRSHKDDKGFPWNEDEPGKSLRSRFLGGPSGGPHKAIILGFSLGIGSVAKKRLCDVTVGL